MAIDPSARDLDPDTTLDASATVLQQLHHSTREVEDCVTSSRLLVAESRDAIARANERLREVSGPAEPVR